MKQFNNNQILQDFQFLSIPGLEISTRFFIRLTSKQIRNCFTGGTLRSLLLGHIDIHILLIMIGLLLACNHFRIVVQLNLKTNVTSGTLAPKMLTYKIL